MLLGMWNLSLDLGKEDEVGDYIPEVSLGELVVPTKSGCAYAPGPGS